jgi:plasmid replication initiation protein
MQTALTEMQYNKEALIIQANELIRSQQDSLSLLEAKLIKLAISQICMYDTDLRTYSCHVTELAAFLEIPQDNVYRDIDILSSSILKKIIYIKDKDKPRKRNGEYNYKKFPWVDYFEYNNGIITIRLSDKLKPYLLGLNALFTEYGLKDVLFLPTANSMKLFDLLKSYEYTINTHSPRFNSASLYPQVPKANNELIFSIPYLKNYFNCEDKYPATKDFIKWVIAASVANINHNQENMRVSYRVAKEGRKIGYVLFKINAWGDSDFREFIIK